VSVELDWDEKVVELGEFSGCYSCVSEFLAAGLHEG
jgi:hypothetical protein